MSHSTEWATKARSSKASYGVNACVVLALRPRGNGIATSNVTGMGTATGEEVDGHRCCH